MKNRRLRIAYDVSWAAEYLTRRDRKTGINRVVEEVLNELIKCNEIDISVVGLYGSANPFVASNRARVYYDFALNRRGRYAGTYSSFTQFSRFFERRFRERYRRLAEAAEQSDQDASSPKMAATELDSCQKSYKRIRYKAGEAIRKLIELDTRQYLDSSFDVLHSPYQALPPRRVTGRTERLLTLYDLIPLTIKDEVPPAWCDIFLKIVESLNVQRDWAICISEFTKKELCAMTGMKAERVFVSPLAAGDHFHPVYDPNIVTSVRSRLSIPQGPYILSLCTPQRRKNLPHLVRSFANLITVRNDIKANLVLVGLRTPAMEILETQFHQKFPILKQRLHLTGYVDDEYLSALYSGASAFVFPSLSEGFGLPPLEAMKCGIPVICSNATSLPEVVGDAAVLIDPQSEAQLAEAIAGVLSCPALANELRQKSLKRASEFSWRKCAERTVEAYQAICG